MAEVILMPRLSDTMTEGVIAAWHKKVGDTVKKGDLLAEIETDKATMELESYQQGTLLHIGGTNGQKLQVNDLLAIIGKAGEDITSLIASNSNNNNTSQKEDGKVTETAKNNTDNNSIDISTLEEVVLMPRLSDTMTEGVIAAWHKNIGDTVAKGEILAEIETDKATMELESYKNGTLLYQGANAGEKIQVNDLLCVIGDKNTNLEQIISASKNKLVSANTETATNEINQQVITPIQTEKSTDSTFVNEGRILASPLAKKLADDRGIDLKYVKGSGDGGRIIKSDVENYQPNSVSNNEVKNQSTEINNIPSAPVGQISFQDTPVSQMRKVIAKRLAESKFSAPHFYLTMNIDMDAAVAARAKINETSSVKISFNDFVLKAVALSLKKHPTVNSSWLGDTIRTNYHVNIGVAVAVEDGLLVPVVRFADGKTLSQIAVEVKDLAQKAKDKKLQPSDWEGNTFTISNLGMFGIDEFTAIINPPDACILAVGGIAKVPVVKNGQVVAGNVMKVTLSCDHRVVDGASGASFLQTLKSFLEEPLRMLV
jgi:pyruvate dehydrogenase E2 component (dihydrolipoamide acetyltransferase)